MINAKIAKLIRQAAKAMKADPELLRKVYEKGDVHQKKRDLIAMRAVVFAKKHIKPGTPYEEQQRIMDEFTKTQDLSDVRWPDIKIMDKKAGQSSEEHSGESGSVSEQNVSK